MYCRPEKRRIGRTKRTANYCPDCGFRIGGVNHAVGKHHNEGTDGRCKIVRSMR